MRSVLKGNVSELTARLHLDYTTRERKCKVATLSEYKKLHEMYEYSEVLKIYKECEWKEVMYSYAEEFAKAKTPEEKKQVNGWFKGSMFLFRYEPILTPYLERKCK